MTLCIELEAAISECDRGQPRRPRTAMTGAILLAEVLSGAQVDAASIESVLARLLALVCIGAPAQ